MKSITVQSFLGYACAGVIFAVIAWWVQSCASSDDRLNPAYSSYLDKKKAFDKAKSAAEMGLTQRHFEEALAGAYPVELLPDADLQEVARGILIMARDSGVTTSTLTELERQDRAKNIASLAYEKGRLRERTWHDKKPLLNCGYGDCTFSPSVSVLGDPSRLLLLLKGDKAGVLVNLPTETALGTEPTYPADGPTKIELPWSHTLRVWIVCSILFALGFLIAGALFYDPEKNKSTDALFLPNFAVGWLVMAAFAPGFLLMHGVNLGLRDAGPWIGRVRSTFFPREFDDEFGELTTRLETMRSREQADGNAIVLGDIDVLIEKIRISKSRRHIAELRKALDAADGYLNGLGEIDRDLSGHPSD
jgi:hypothetical protein